MQNIHLDAERAEKLIQAYGKVLELITHYEFGAPMSLLPQPKKTIKEAIIKYLQYSHSINELDDDKFNLLKVGYMLLSKFIDDNEASIGEKARLMIASQDPERIRSPAMKKALLLISKSNEESIRLADEFDNIVSRLGINIPKQNSPTT